MNAIKVKTFTREYDGISRVLVTQCGISEAFDPKDIKKPRIEKFNAIWDTGATASVISKRVVKALSLEPNSKMRVFHAGGGGDFIDAYSVNIFLPNNTAFYIKRATEAELTGADVLIGMDIISSGDFAVTTSKGKTKFSFQVPSTHDIDFVKEHKQKLGEQPQADPEGVNNRML
jgi:hypothetical protein